MKKENWEEEFDKDLFESLSHCYEPGGILIIKDFIRQSLEKEKANLLSKIRDLKSKQYEPSNILEIIENDLEFNKGEH